MAPRSFLVRVSSLLLGARGGRENSCRLYSDATQLDETRLKECTSLSPLNGYWEGQRFHPSVASQPCALVRPTTFSPSPTATETSPLVWIHLVGDSNIRNLYGAFVNSFGKGLVASHEVTDSSIRNGTFASVALRSSSSRSLKAPPNVIITWTWFESKSQAFELNAEELDHWTSGTLGEFLNRASLPDALSSHPDLERAAVDLLPTRTYISLGSHSEDLTALGEEKLLDVYLAENHLSMKRREAVNARFFSTTFVQSAKIPVGRIVIL